MRRLLPIAIVFAFITLGRWCSDAQIPAGIVTYTCTHDTNVLWDASEIIQLKQLDLGVAQLETDVHMNVEFTQNGAGKLSGAGFTSIYVNSPIFEGAVSDAKYKVTGLIRSKSGVTKVSFRITGKGNIFVDGKKVSISTSGTRTAYLDSHTRTLWGTYMNRASAEGVGSGTDTGELPQTWEDIRPYAGDGRWNLVLNLDNNGPSKITGLATLTLNSGAQYLFTVRGAYNAKTGLSKLTLLGDASARGSSLRVVLTNACFASIEGKVAGQKIKLIAERGTDTTNGPPVVGPEPGPGTTNHAPVLAAIVNKTVQVGSLLSFNATATDEDAGQTLTYSLAPGAPTGASITTAGSFSWTPTTSQGPAATPITIVVTDNGAPPLNDSKTITVTVTTPAGGPVLTGPATTTGSIPLVWTFAWPGGLASSRNGYELEQSTTSSTTGFNNIWTSVNTDDRVSPRTVNLTRTAGTYWFRVRAALNSGYSVWSNIKQVTVTTPSGIEAIASVDNLLMFTDPTTTSQTTCYPRFENAIGNWWTYWFYTGTSVLACQSAIKFDVTSSIAGRQIASATLRLWPHTLPLDLNTVYQVAAYVDSWNPNTITFSNQPAHYISGLANAYPPVTTTLPVEWDVTAIVRNWANGTWANNGFWLGDAKWVYISYDADRTTAFDSLEVWYNLDHKPKLIIEFQ